MSYVKISKEIEAQTESFAADVFQYLEDTGRSERGRSYFGTLACGNPNLVSRLEAGKLPGLEVMLQVRTYMEKNPAPTQNSDEVGA